MEGTEGNNTSGVTVRGDEASDSYKLAPRGEKCDQSGTGGLNMPAPALIYTPVNLGPVVTKHKKKRGRPRKYEQDGTRIAISPMPISAAVPVPVAAPAPAPIPVPVPLGGGGGGDYSSSSAWKQDRPVVEPFKEKKQKLEFGSCNIGDGQGVPNAFSANFTPHILTVNTGEDVSMRIISFSQQSSRTICILAANGIISNVTLRQHNSSGGTLTYEGMFEIISLTGTFKATDDGVTKSRTGGMNICLSGPDGNVFGGALAGLLIAAVPVQVVIGSYLMGNNQLEEIPKKQKTEFTINYCSSGQANHATGNGTDGSFSVPRPNLTPPPSTYHGTDVINPTPLNSRPIPNSTAPNNIISFGREDSENCKISC